MKITNIRVLRENLELTKPYTIAFKTVTTVENMIVLLELNNGITGYGAGNPSEKVVGESIDMAQQALQPENLAFLLGRDIREFQQLSAEILMQFPKNPGARAALDIALYDAFARYLDVPLVRFLGQKQVSLPTSVTIGIMNTEETLKEALEFYKLGFTVLKVKTGKSLEEDLERIIKLREVLGGAVKIRVDANQGYSDEETITWFQQSESLDIELVEQPVPQDHLLSTSFPPDYKKRIAADETLLSPESALQLAKAGVCGIFNIKLMKCGGISQALQIASIAQPAGIELMWGCNDESIISISAALHAALSCAHTRYLDLDGSFDLAKDVVEGGFILSDGQLSTNGMPGLGTRPLSGL